MKGKLTVRYAALALAVFAFAACSLGGDVETWRAKAVGEDGGKDPSYTITYTVSPNSTTNTTALNFTFSSSVSGLSASVISISSGTGSLTKGTPTGSGTSWTLPLTVNTPGIFNVSIQISRSGIDSSQKMVNVYKIISYTVTPDSTANTTALNFTFSGSVSGLGLSASGINITGGTGSLTKRMFTGSGTSWTLPVTVNTPGTVSVSISRSGIESGTKTVTVYKPSDSSVINYTVTPDSTSETTALNFTFFSSVALSDSDISVSGGTGSVTRGMLTGGGTSWTLPVTVNTAGTITISISRSGIESGAKTVNVYKIISYTVAPDSTSETTALNFTFSDSVALSDSDISVSGGTGSVTRGILTGGGTSWTLPVTVSTEGTVSVSITKSWIESGTKTVNVYKTIYSVTLLNNPPYGWQYSNGLEGAYTGTQTNKGDVFTFSYSFKSNVFIDKLQVVLVDCVEPDYVWKTLSGYVPVSENIQPNTEITGSITITATSTATSASFLANRLVIETTAGTSSQPTLTFTSISLVKTTSAVTASGSTLSAQLNWLKNNAASNSSYILTANASETIAPQNLSWNGKNNIMVFLQGDYTDRTISLSAQGAMFTVGSGLTLILDNNITLQGRSDNNSSVLQVLTGGELIMKTGSKITGNSNVDYSSGVYVASGGIFTMDGGEISGNTASSGGGVAVKGTFIMNGGIIIGNTASLYGGGVILDLDKIFTMNGGEITGNSAEDGGGVEAYGIFTMNGGTISGNTASRIGGGVDQYDGTFRMNGGTIYGSSASSTLRNTADSSGAALYKASDATANYGVYSGGTFYPSGTLSTTNDTLRVQNGTLYNN